MRKSYFALVMLLFFVLQVIYAGNPYDAIDPYTLPEFKGKLPDPDAKVVYENKGYLFVEQDGVLYVYFLK